MNKPAEIEAGAMEKIKTSFPDTEVDKMEKAVIMLERKAGKDKKAQSFPLPQRGGF